MVVGESVYDWGNGFDTRYKETNGLRETHRRHALDYRRDSPYVRNIERAVYRKREPSAEQKRELWSTVAYHNLVLEPLKDIKARPTYPQYLKGWQEFFELSHMMAVDQAIIYGLEARKVDALVEAIRLRGVSFEQSCLPAKIGRTRPRMVTIANDGRTLKLLLIRHPSAFFSWRQWAPVIREHLPLQLPKDVARINAVQ
ncbi:conserved hypothetical protein [Cupriavidus taiwanensis]|uniref:Uncharacterized protein n=2 Tax=Cupriavidus taiwanensis TaxID=164546 RepID=A0A375FJ19_9BURK|nr:hypothetical protein [Cupriavidus taiwanensis]SOZ73353.1 conserved hypothetical protein [Cupriavidus taiwanensis]SOZ73887.1 conserved hypothetical protein [Cupriavidus taiwanensis]SOZ75336.1 conserved hypothetical protein [Cupriavidus taiwanensis]SPA03875.1 conserved hypothetical protein [Cupriavidus taiwanensis]SPA12941.1 conserved hypothetical protein [Cupriavidus taiwanensis]